MQQDMILNNKVEIVGTISSDFEFSHSVYGEKFYMFSVEVIRLSHNTDTIPVTISERVLLGRNFQKRDKVCIAGQYRSYNNYTEVGNKLILTVFVKDIIHYSEEYADRHPNAVYLHGFICKPPIFRTTPFGREITDVLLAINRTYNKSDYIPCIAWGRNARFASALEVGERLTVYGRIQSREYQKRIDENESIKKTAYEVSISKLEIDEISDAETDIEVDYNCDGKG